MKNQIFPCLWFDGQAKAAADLYCNVFGNSKITMDSQMVVNFELDGQKFMYLNGGPQFKINPSISFYVVLETAEEVNIAWNKLLEGGSVLMPIDTYPWSERYGWLQDQFGVNWQLSYGKLADVGQKFSPTMMFVGEQQGKAEEAIHLYTSLFDNAKIDGILRYTADENDVEGTIKHAQFSLDGYVMMAMDSSAAHHFAFNEAVSFVVNCETQEEIDFYWDKLTEGGAESMCGWLKDKFGISWQIIPASLGELMSNPDPAKSQRVIQALMQMRKIDIKSLKEA